MSKVVMFIDDDEAFLAIARRACKRIPQIERMIDALDGAQAISLLTTLLEASDILPDLIFVDINMPVLDGFGFLQRLAELRKGHPELASVRPVAMLTSSDQASDREKAAKLGADEYIVKAPGLAETADTIARFV